MKLNQIKATPGARTKRTRVGRGRSSGMGKTSGYGQKGQGAHNKHPRPGFEGGQTPLARRFPKRGFKNYQRVSYAIVNVSQLEKAAGLISGEMNVDTLRKHKVIADTLHGLRVLGEGEITKAVTVTALHFSKSAKEKIEKAGGKAIVAAAAPAPSKAQAK